jgi:hypothetical protein
MWLGRFLISFFFLSSITACFSQNEPARIPKVLYSCDTAGVLGCFPLIRNGDKNYVLGNAAKASLSGEEATIAVEQHDAVEIVISYKDLDKSAIFSGRLMGNRVQGAVVSSTSAGGKIVKLDGKWIALAVTEAADFSQISSRLPAVMNVCQTNDDDRNATKEDCFTLSWDVTNPVFAGNLMTIERFDEHAVSIMGMSQHGTGVLAAYSGKLDGNRIHGTVDYFSGDGHNWAGKWTASFEPASASAAVPK